MDELKNALGFDPERLAADTDTFFARLGEMFQAGAEITARAESPDRRVAVEYSSREGVQALDIDPRAMRGSAQDLSATILGLIREAQQQVEAQGQEALTSFLDDDSVLINDREAIGKELRNAAGAMQENLAGAAETLARFRSMMRR